jgi:hypothetical protein
MTAETERAPQIVSARPLPDFRFVQGRRTLHEPDRWERLYEVTTSDGMTGELWLRASPAPTAAREAPSYPEGETPADVRVLRQANIDLAMQSHMLATVLADLLGQVRQFIEENGEADFYTGHASAALHRYNPLDYLPPIAESCTERMLSFVGASPERVALPEQPTGDEWLKEHERLAHLAHYAIYSWGFEAGKVGQHVDTTIAQTKAARAYAALLAHARLRPAAGGEAAAQDAVCCAECGKKHADGWALYCVECALNIAPAFSTKLPASLKIDLTEDAAKFLRDTLNSGGDDTPDITLALTNGHSGYGLYQWETEYPEEGANLVQPIAIPTAQAGDATNAADGVKTDGGTSNGR